MSRWRKGGRLGLPASCMLVLVLAATTTAAGASADPPEPGGPPLRVSLAVAVRFAAPLTVAALTPACAEPEYLRLASAVAGQPFQFSEALDCLPAEDALSQPTIVWGDGTTSPGAVTPLGPPGDEERVSGQHAYGRAGGFRVTVRVVDLTSDETLVRGWHTAVDVAEPATGAPGAAPGSPTGAGGSAGSTGSHAQPPGNPPGAAASVRTLSFPARTGQRRLGAVALVLTGAPAADLRALIHWGDGSTSRGTLRGRPPDLRVLGAHRWRRPGRYRITIVVVSASGQMLARGVAHACVRGAGAR